MSASTAYQFSPEAKPLSYCEQLKDLNSILFILFIMLIYQVGVGILTCNHKFVSNLKDIHVPKNLEIKPQFGKLFCVKDFLQYCVTRYLSML
jgi:hypothetical protein